MSAKVYKIIGADGKPRHIEANTRAAAIQHVYAPVVEGPLSGAAVRALMSADPKAVEVAGASE